MVEKTSALHVRLTAAPSQKSSIAPRQELTRPSSRNVYKRPVHYVQEAADTRLEPATGAAPRVS